MAVQTYLYMSSAELRAIDPDMLDVLMQDNPIFEFFPQTPTQSHRLTWEQRDNYQGMMQTRGFNSPAPSVRMVGSSRFDWEPSSFGEYAPIDEREILERAAPATFHIPISIDDLVMERTQMLQHRQVQLMAYILWTLVETGLFTQLDNKGAIVAQDGYTPLRKTSGVAWTSPATATPLADFRAVKLLHRGRSVTFGSRATAFMNQTTFNAYIANTNNADIYGRRRDGLATYENLDEINKLHQKDDLPQIVIWDEGFIGEDGLFHLWIPDGVVAVIGRRTNGAQLGEFRLTRNANNEGGGSAPYLKVVDRGAGPNDPPPRRIEVHRGFNGGPVIYYAGAICIMQVF
jgi:hypothetical protein